MKRDTHILLLVVLLLPLLCRGEEETMEQRKRRIMRKYLRERIDITYSEEAAPGAMDAEEDLLDSKRFKDVKPQLEAEDINTRRPMPSRPAPPPAPQIENRNWLLMEPAEEAVDTTDPFGKNSRGEPREALDDWMIRSEGQQESTSYFDTQRNTIFDQRDSRFQSQPDPRTERYDPAQMGNRYRSEAPFNRTLQAGRPMERPNEPTEAYGGWRGSASSPFSSSVFSSPNTYQRQPESGLNRAPGMTSYFQQDARYRNSGGIRREQQVPGRYIPYKSPYQNQQQQPWATGTSTEPFRRQDGFEQWRQRNAPAYNPMGEDAYVNELMPRNQR